MTLTADISIKNPNVASFKYPNTTTTIYYHGTVIGEAHGPAGKSKAQRTMRMNVTVDVVMDKLISKPNLLSDMSTGILAMSSFTRVGGRVKMFNIIKRHAVVKMNCTINVNITSRAIQDQKCKKKGSPPGGGAAPPPPPPGPPFSFSFSLPLPPSGFESPPFPLVRRAALLSLRRPDDWGSVSPLAIVFISAFCCDLLVSLDSTGVFFFVPDLLVLASSAGGLSVAGVAAAVGVSVEGPAGRHLLGRLVIAPNGLLSFLAGYWGWCSASGRWMVFWAAGGVWRWTAVGVVFGGWWCPASVAGFSWPLASTSGSVLVLLNGVAGAAVFCAAAVAGAALRLGFWFGWAGPGVGRALGWFLSLFV
ncbi:hypothetical protein Vadar_019171 [Vaccinium darrowii]|uniref:Uncharacterized protein n=1 Tax=Vaccinium darrowii TaxID=229202 RepID=A0ACB7Y8U4_9ERIC|nr:hypothetical protein Vadar_019171 [Vaccinium darrowii]